MSEYWTLLSFHVRWAVVHGLICCSFTCLAGMTSTAAPLSICNLPCVTLKKCVDWVFELPLCFIFAIYCKGRYYLAAFRKCRKVLRHFLKVSLLTVLQVSFQAGHGVSFALATATAIAAFWYLKFFWLSFSTFQVPIGGVGEILNQKKLLKDTWLLTVW